MSARIVSSYFLSWLIPVRCLLSTTVALLCGLTTAPLSLAQKNLDSIKPSIVLITMFDQRDSKAIPRSFGSGSVIDEDGSILTNHHVVAKETGHALYDFFIVSRYQGNDSPPVPYCKGTPIKGALDPTEDLAVIRCDRTLGGRNYEPQNWPTIIASPTKSMDIKPGTQIWVFGYTQQKHNENLVIQAGLTAGWSESKDTIESPPFLRTDANISLGMSGGAAIDSNGKFIGVPTAFRKTISNKYAAFIKGKIGLIRTVDSVSEIFLKTTGRSSRLIKIQDATTHQSIPNASIYFHSSDIPSSKQSFRRSNPVSDHRGLLRFKSNEITSSFILAPGYLPTMLNLEREEFSKGTTSGKNLNLVQYPQLR